MPNYRSDRPDQSFGRTKRLGAENRIGQFRFVRPPARLEGAQTLVVDVAPTEVEDLIAMFTRPSDAFPEQQMVRPLGPQPRIRRTVLIGDRPPPEEKDGCCSRTIVAHGNEDEAVARLDHPLPKRLEEPARLNQKSLASPSEKMKLEEGLEQIVALLP